MSMLTAGVAVTAYVFSPSTANPPAHVVDGLRLHAPAGFGSLTPAPSTASDQRTAAAFAPSSPLFSPGAPLSYGSQKPTAASQPVAAGPKPVLVRQAPVLVRQTASTAFVQRSDTGGASPAAEFSAYDPYNPDSRYKLITELQRELRRAGCYWGRIDGDWGPGSKRGIKTFMDRVNASLPVHTPDTIQLALVRSHPGKVCGKSCATGETLSASGRCVPRPVIASKPNSKPSQANSKAVADYAVAASSSRQNTAASARTTTAAKATTAGWVASVEKLPIVVPVPRLAVRPSSNKNRAVAAAQPAIRAGAAEINRRRPPPPGRMALSGPRPAEVPANESTPGVSVLPDTFKAPAPRQVRRSTAQARQAAVRKETANKAKAKARNWKKRKRYSKAVRQRRIMREAFGDTMF